MATHKEHNVPAIQHEAEQKLTPPLGDFRGRRRLLVEGDNKGNNKGDMNGDNKGDKGKTKERENIPGYFSNNSA